MNRFQLRIKNKSIPGKENCTQKRPEERLNEALQSTMRCICLELKLCSRKLCEISLDNWRGGRRPQHKRSFLFLVTENTKK